MSRAAKSRQAAALAATEAADALLAWLRSQPKKADTYHPASDEPATPPEPHAAMDRASAEPAPDTLAPLEPAETAVPDDPAPDPDWRHRHAPQRLAHPDWLFHRLRVSGSRADLAAFRAAAAGAGTIPWQLNLARMEEDFFHLLIAPPRRLSLSGARILAGQLRAAVALRHALAVAQVGQSQACPFDLQALVPVLRVPEDQAVALRPRPPPLWTAAMQSGRSAGCWLSCRIAVRWRPFCRRSPAMRRNGRCAAGPPSPAP